MSETKKIMAKVRIYGDAVLALEDGSGTVEAVEETWTKINEYLPALFMCVEVRVIGSDEIWVATLEIDGAELFWYGADEICHDVPGTEWRPVREG